MDGYTTERTLFEDRWRLRLKEARARLDLAHGYRNEVQRQFPKSNIPASDHHYEFQEALNRESIALAEYERVLQIFTNLILKGVIPDEEEWNRRHKA